MNTVNLIGRLTKDPELKYTQSNIPFTNFTLAVNRQFKDENGENQADFINCLTWRKQAENLVKYQSKGSQIAITGRIQTRTYEAENGTRYIVEVVADNIQFLDPVKSRYPETDAEIDETFKHGNPVNPPEKLVNEPKDDSLPF